MISQLNFSRTLSEDSRIWIYQTNRVIGEEELPILSHEIDCFINKWAAHGNGLFADFSFFSPYTLIIAVDDTKVPPSGCSIDALVRFLTSLGAQFDIDFFVRMKAVILANGEWKQVDFAEVNVQDNSVLLVDPTIGNLKDFRLSGLVNPLKSGLKELFK
jgi:hypothetical protein